MPIADPEQWCAPDRPAMCDLLIRHREELARRVVIQLAHAPTYGELDPNRLHARVLRLIDLLVASLQGESAIFSQNVERLVRTWFVAGPWMEDVLRALSVLQLEVWSLVVARQSSSQEQRWVVSDLTSCIGAARDQLARVYLASDEPPEPRGADASYRGESSLVVTCRSSTLGYRSSRFRALRVQ